MIRTHDEIHADRVPLTIVPLIETAPQTALSATETADDPKFCRVVGCHPHRHDTEETR